jgi:DNA invertase Pin-like site-specific DNA recombinase
MKVAIYLRVSTKGQTVNNQLRDLEAVAKNANWEITQVYSDNGVSGAKGRAKRPELDKMLNDATRRRFSKLLAWDISRLGRSLSDLLEITKTLEEAKVSLYFHRDAVDTSSASGRLFFNIVASIGEFERERISERITAGLATAKAKGKTLGRKKGFYTSDVKNIQKLRKEGSSIRGIAKALGCSPTTVHKHIHNSESRP